MDYTIRFRGEERDAVRAVNSFRDSIDKTRTVADGLKRDLKGAFDVDSRGGVRETNRLESAVKDVSGAAEKLRRELRESYSTSSRGGVTEAGQLEGAVKEVSQAADKLERELKDAYDVSSSKGVLEAKRMERAVNDIHDGGGRMRGVMMGAFGAMATGAAAAGVGLGIVGGVVGKVGLDFVALKESSEVSFTTMLGSGQKAKAFLDDLAKFAAKTPFAFPELIQASQQLLNMGFNAKEIIPVMTAVGDAVSAAGGDPQKMEATVRALGQVQAKGRLMAEEMMQLAEAGTFSWKALAKQLGVSVSEAMDMVKKGQVDAAEFTQAFIANSTERFGGLMQKQSATFSGMLSTLKDTFAQFAGGLMEPLLPAIKGAMKAATDAMDDPGFKAGVERVRDAIIDGFRNAFDIVVEIARRFGPTLIDAFRDYVSFVEGVAAEVVRIVQDHEAELQRIGAVLARVFDGARAAVVNLSAVALASLGPIITVVDRIVTQIDEVVEAFGGWEGAITAVILAWAGFKVAGVVTAVLTGIGQMRAAMLGFGGVTATTAAGQAAVGAGATRSATVTAAAAASMNRSMTAVRTQALLTGGSMTAIGAGATGAAATSAVAMGRFGTVMAGARLAVARVGLAFLGWPGIVASVMLLMKPQIESFFGWLEKHTTAKMGRVGEIIRSAFTYGTGDLLRDIGDVLGTDGPQKPVETSPMTPWNKPGGNDRTLPKPGSSAERPAPGGTNRRLPKPGSSADRLKGPKGGTKGGGGDFQAEVAAAGSIEALGSVLQKYGYIVGEHPKFGGVGSTHTGGSYHYKGQALDINHAGNEPAMLDALAEALAKNGNVVELIWRAEGHFDHLHVAFGPAGPQGSYIKVGDGDGTGTGTGTGTPKAKPDPEAKSQAQPGAVAVRKRVEALTEKLDLVPDSMKERLQKQLEAINKLVAEGLVTDGDIASAKRRLDALQAQINRAVTFEKLRESFEKVKETVKKSLLDGDIFPPGAEKRIRDQMGDVTRAFAVALRDLKIDPGELKRIRAEIDQLERMLVREFRRVGVEGGKAVKELVAAGTITPAQAATVTKQIAEYNKAIRKAWADGILTPGEIKQLAQKAAGIARIIDVAEIGKALDEEIKKAGELFRKGWLTLAEYVDAKQLGEKIREKIKLALKDGRITAEELKGIQEGWDQLREINKKGAEEAADAWLVLTEIPGLVKPSLDELEALLKQGVITQEDYDRFASIPRRIKEAFADGVLTKAEYDAIMADYDELDNVLEQGARDSADNAKVWAAGLGDAIGGALEDSVLTPAEIESVRGKGKNLKGALKESFDEALAAVDEARDDFDDKWGDFKEAILDAFEEQVVGKLKLQVDTADAALELARAANRVETELRKNFRTLSSLDITPDMTFNQIWAQVGGAFESGATAFTREMNKRGKDLAGAWENYWAVIGDPESTQAERDAAIATLADAEQAFDEWADSVAPDDEQGRAVINGWNAIIGHVEAAGDRSTTVAVAAWEKMTGEQKLAVGKMLDDVYTELMNGTILWPEAVEKIQAGLVKAGMTPEAAEALLNGKLADPVSNALTKLNTTIKSLATVLERLVEILEKLGPDASAAGDKAAGGVDDASAKVEAAMRRMIANIQQLAGTAWASYQSYLNAIGAMGEDAPQDLEVNPGERGGGGRYVQPDFTPPGAGAPPAAPPPGPPPVVNPPPGGGYGYYAHGGWVRGRPSAGIDKVLARLTPGELVLNKRQQGRLASLISGLTRAKVGAQQLWKLARGYEHGGPVVGDDGLPRFQDGGEVPPSSLTARLSEQRSSLGDFYASSAAARAANKLGYGLDGRYYGKDPVRRAMDDLWWEGAGSGFVDLGPGPRVTPQANADEVAMTVGGVPITFGELARAGVATGQLSVSTGGGPGTFWRAPGSSGLSVSDVYKLSVLKGTNLYSKMTESEHNSLLIDVGAWHPIDALLPYRGKALGAYASTRDYASAVANIPSIWSMIEEADMARYGQRPLYIHPARNKLISRGAPAASLVPLRLENVPVKRPDGSWGTTTQIADMRTGKTLDPRNAAELLKAEIRTLGDTAMITAPVSWQGMSNYEQMMYWDFLARQAPATSPGGMRVSSFLFVDPVSGEQRRIYPLGSDGGGGGGDGGGGGGGDKGSSTAGGMSSAASIAAWESAVSWWRNDKPVARALGGFIGDAAGDLDPEWLAGLAPIGAGGFRGVGESLGSLTGIPIGAGGSPARVYSTSLASSVAAFARSRPTAAPGTVRLSPALRPGVVGRGYGPIGGPSTWPGHGSDRPVVFQVIVQGNARVDRDWAETMRDELVQIARRNGNALGGHG